MKFNTKDLLIICLFQFVLLVVLFSLPNTILNGATWYAVIVNFGRIGLLFGFPLLDLIFLLVALKKGKRLKLHLRQFIDSKDYYQYDLLSPLYFLNLNVRQVDSIILASSQSDDDLILDINFPFDLLLRYLQ